MVLNSSVGSTEVLVSSGVGVFLGTVELRARMVVGYGDKGFKAVDLTSKGGERLVRAVLTMVGTSKRAVSVVDVVFLLDILVDLGR